MGLPKPSSLWAPAHPADTCQAHVHQSKTCSGVSLCHLQQTGRFPGSLEEGLDVCLQGSGANVLGSPMHAWTGVLPLSHHCSVHWQAQASPQ